ncbi:MAG: Gfo/Idh/MocA family oxidoreductase [Actinomycetales bacterium]|nr:Gfo/Idh/MocA family oxidoreductase [Actinomycetales bacterium]
MIRVGLVGAGAHMQENLLPALRAIPQVEVCSVMSRDAAKATAFARRWSIPYVSHTIDDLVGLSHLAMVVAAATPDVHLATLDAALANGLNAYIEKPPAPSGQELASVLASHSTSSGVATAGFNFRFADVSIGTLGALSAVGRARYARVAVRSRKPLGPIWDFASAEKSFMYAVGIHAVDFALSIFPASTIASASAVRTSGGRFACSLQFVDDTGGVCDVLISNAANRFEFEVDITAERGRVTAHDLTTIQLQRFEPSASALGEKAVENSTLSGLNSGYLRNGYQRLLESALTSSGEIDSPAPIEESVRVLDALDAVCARLGFA